ncbi:hypothetical protein MXD81_20130, partial [Microbacteriaceae bacterium K1510]|nr:hypothetical protein [Microbacteriaceae bacterium K1510]
LIEVSRNPGNSPFLQLYLTHLAHIGINRFPRIDPFLDSIKAGGNQTSGQQVRIASAVSTPVFKSSCSSFLWNPH